MSAPTEEMERQSDLFRFIDLMVRQTCRRAYYEKETRIKTSKEDKDRDKDSIYSNDHLTKVYDSPREYIYQLVKNPQKTLKGLRVENAGTFLRSDEDGFTKIEEKMLLDFAKKVHEHAPKAHLVWIDLQHYLFYAYRRFASWSPKTATETLSSYFVCEMRELINCLRTEDESQLWLRVFTLLREYCIFAQWHYSHNDKEEALAKFIIYYEAMLSAAKSLLPVFVDFEKDILYKNYRVCWIDFNSFIFIRFFYESDRVKIKVDECLRTKKSPGDTPQTFALLNKIRTAWSTHHTKTSLINEVGKLAENSPEALKEKKLLINHKKLLSATFWVDRSKDSKKNIDLSRMDHNLFDLLRDKFFYPEGPGLNKNGQCICEECLIAKYKIYLDSNDDFSCIATEERTTFCRKCKRIVPLDQFHRHLNRHTDDIPVQKEISKHNLANLSMEKIDFAKVGTVDTTNLCELFRDKLKISGGESLNHVEHSKPKKQDINSTKTSYEKLVQSKKDSKSGEKVKNGRSPSLRDELIANGFGKALGDGSNQLPSPHVTAEKLAEVELMLRDLRKLGHKPSHYILFESGDSVSEESDLSTPNDEHEQPKVCDCTYCEVFGGTKIVEPRTKLRIRLYKRREPKKENDIDQKITSEENNGPKTDNRVPVPPSPDSSDFEAEKMNEIRGLVNYIEGYEAKTKAELAQKKAAKKARQREKKEQEKLQAELEIQRRLEEQIRQEEERQEMLKMQREKLEEEKKLEEAKLKKKLKKMRQAEKRQAMALQKTTIEETIPAMVTIKRIAGGENGTPSVIITLKGCTPDQDKLLTSLVEEPADVEMQSSDIKVPSTTKTSTETNGGKKKLKNTKPNPEPVEVPQLSTEPKLISKGVTVTLAVDKNPVPIKPEPIIIQTFEKQPKKIKQKEVKREREPTEEEIRSLGNLRLPPGITLTKIEGPVSNRNYLESNSSNGSSMMSKSGVIVVDTEKLIKKNETEASKAPKRLSKNKKNKKRLEAQTNAETKDKPKMVTLRNPMFQQLQSQNLSKKASAPIEESAPAAIFTTENGMVTIRSSRLQQSLKNDLSKPPTSAPLGMPPNPNLLPEMSNLVNQNHFRQKVSSNNIEEPMELDSKKTTIAPIDAQEILLGLPGIEITKIEKNAKPEDMHTNNSCQDAEVSIIPSNGPEFNLDFDKNDDWLYDDNIFKPRDVLEDDMDDEELEIEEFKRFCQESIPPKEKTVAHFNVADIILKKKLK